MTPIYTETAAYAKSVGELDLYRVSLHENKNCKNAIDKAISENFDGFRLKKDCYKPVIEQFGQERMLYVLANTLQLRGWDGRFSRDNKAWAEHFSIPGDPATGGEHRFLFQCESHPTVFGWIHQPDAPRTGKAEILRSGRAEKCRFPIQRSSAEPERD